MFAARSARGLIGREGSTAAGIVPARATGGWVMFTSRTQVMIQVGARQDAGESFETVSESVEDPMPIRGSTAIPLHEVEVRASRSSGPGGQHANKTASRIEASFEVTSSGSLTDEQKRRIVARLGPRVVAVAQDARSQSRNRELALQRLAQRLGSALKVARPRQATRPTRAAVNRRLTAKRRQAERKRDRRPPGADA